MKLRIFNHKFDSSNLCFICEMAHACFVYAQKYTYKAINVEFIEGFEYNSAVKLVLFSTNILLMTWIIRPKVLFYICTCVFFGSCIWNLKNRNLMRSTHTHTHGYIPVEKVSFESNKEIIAVQQMKKIHKQTND